MNPQRRTALISVGAAVALVALKLVPGITTHSLGLISEALHSGTDLVAALLTFFAIGVAIRPADRAHAYGHGKAEHLAALAEAGFLVVASLFIGWRSVSHIVGRTEPTVQAKWYALAVIGGVLVLDAGRMLVSLRTARRYKSAALQANALHFGSDLGAREIDMVMNIPALKNHEKDVFMRDIHGVVAMAAEQDAMVKVITENCFLSEEEKRRACDWIADTGADFVKTSTAYAEGGAILDDDEVPGLQVDRARREPAVTGTHGD